MDFLSHIRKPVITLVAASILTASTAIGCNDEKNPPTATSSPTATVLVQPTQTPTLETTITGTPTHSPTATVTPNGTATPYTLDPTRTVTPTPTPHPTPNPTDTVTPTATPNPTATFTPNPTTTPAPLPDLNPYTRTDLGWTQPIIIGQAQLVLGNNNNDTSLYVGASLRNSGTSTETGFSVKLYIDDLEAQTWHFNKAPEKKATTVNVKLEDAIRNIWNQYDTFLEGGTHKFKIVIDPDNTITEANETNNTYETDLKYAIAKKPAPRREPQSNTEAKVQQMFDNNTWITNNNVSEVTEIAKAVLKDVQIDWNQLQIDVLPYDEFNAKYTNTVGTPISDDNLLRGIGFLVGTNSSQNIYLREGILAQALPLLIREVGAAYYIQTNSSGLVKANTVSYTQGDRELEQTLFTAYGLAVLEEKFGWKSLTNISYITDTTSISNFVNSRGSVGMTVRSIWAAAIDEGYPDGNVPSHVWLDLYKQLVEMPDPTRYVIGLGDKAKKLDEANIIEILNLRRTDKEPTRLGDSISSSPSTKYLDEILVAQTITAYP